MPRRPTYCAARPKAAALDVTLSALIEDALRARLADPRAVPRPKFRLIIFGGDGLQPAVCWESVDGIIDAVHDRRTAIRTGDRRQAPHVAPAELGALRGSFVPREPNPAAADGRSDGPTRTPTSRRRMTRTHCPTGVSRETTDTAMGHSVGLKTRPSSRASGWHGACLCAARAQPADVRPPSRWPVAPWSTRVAFICAARSRSLSTRVPLAGPPG